MRTAGLTWQPDALQPDAVTAPEAPGTDRTSHDRTQTDRRISIRFKSETNRYIEIYQYINDTAAVS